MTLKTRAMTVKRILIKGFNQPLPTATYGMDHLCTVFSPDSVSKAIKTARKTGYAHVIIVRRKPVFAKDRFTYTVFGRW